MAFSFTPALINIDFTLFAFPLLEVMVTVDIIVPINAASPTDWMLSGTVILVKLLQPINA